MSRPLIHILQDGPDTLISPGQFLGTAEFLRFRTACRNSGAQYDAVNLRNTIRLDLLPALLAALGEAFDVRLSSGAVQAAKDRASAILASRAQALDRVASLTDKPYPFQEVGIAALASRHSFLLGDEMRLGKTPQSLLAIPAGAAALVICPARLTREWLKAAARWRPDLRARVLERFDLPLPGELVIINYERLPVSRKEALVKTLKEREILMADAIGGADLSSTVVIVDEAHYLKSSKSARTQRFRELGRAVRRAGGRTWALTGTPMTGTPMDLLQVLTSFDLLKESFGNYIRFCDLMNGKKDYWGKWTFGAPRPGAVEALRRVMLRRTRAQVFPELPAIAYEDIEVDIKASARKASDAARAAMIAAGVDLQAVIEGRQSLGGAQECVFTARRLLAEAKIPALIEIVQEYIDEDQPLIVGSAHRAPIEALASLPGCRMMTKSEESSQLAEDFQAGKFCVIGGTIKVVAVGFMLARATQILIVDDEFTPDWHDQFVSRAWLIGKTAGVVVKRMIAPDTIDADVAAIIAIKRATIKATVDAAASSADAINPQELLDLGERK